MPSFSPAGFSPAPPDPAAISELADLFREFNRMSDQLARTHEAWREQVMDLQRQVREKDELLSRKNRLESLGEMAAGVAHEIRNPLGGIQLWASLLERDLAALPDHLRIARKIGDAARHLDRVVQELLNFTHVPRPAYEACRPAALAREAVSLLASVIGERRVDVRVEADEALSVQADQVMLRQVFLNLVSNAVQHTPEGKRVAVRVKAEDDLAASACLVEVEDEGPGVPEEFRAKIFYPFFSRRPGGTGLGLTIVSRIVTAHGGAVTVDSSPSGGARFTLRLPRNGA